METAESYKSHYKIRGQEEVNFCRTHNRSTKFYHGNYHHTSRDTKKIDFNVFRDGTRTQWTSKNSPPLGVDPNLRSPSGINTKRRIVNGLKNPKYIKHKQGVYSNFDTKPVFKSRIVKCGLKANPS